MVTADITPQINVKVCIVGPALKMGGMERASVNLANSLDEMGIQAVYIAIFRRTHFFKLNPKIQLYEPHFNHRNLSVLQSLSWIRKIIMSEQPDAVVVYNKFYSALVLLALIRTDFKIYVSERSSPLYNWPLKLRTIIFVAFKLHPPAGVIAQTTIAANYQRNFYRRKIPIQVIPNALREVARYPEIAREKIILAVGRFNEALKGFDRLIDAFARVRNRDWILMFAGGDEADGEYLRAQAEKLGILHRVRFVGAVQDIDLLYARAGIFVIPSRSEGFPNALCEAMAAGLPCVSFDFVAGPRDIITDRHDGYIVEDGNIDLLAQKLDTLMEQPVERKRLGENALQIRDRFRRSKIALQHLKFMFPDKYLQSDVRND